MPLDYTPPATSTDPAKPDKWGAAINTIFTSIKNFVNGLETTVNSAASSAGTAAQTAQSAQQAAQAAQEAAEDAAAAAVAGATAAVVTTKTASWVVSEADGDIALCNNTAAAVATVPSAWPVGESLEVIQRGTGSVTVAGNGVTVTPYPAGASLTTSERNQALWLTRVPGQQVTQLPTSGLLASYWADSITAVDGSAVGSLPDSSGNALPAATQGVAGSQPVIQYNAGNTGHKALYFDGTNDHLLLSGTALDLARNRTALTVFFLIRYGWTPPGTGRRTLLDLSSGTSSAASRAVLQARESSGGQISAGARRLDTDAGSWVNGPGASAAGTFLFTVEFDYANADLYSRLNGSTIASNTAWQTAGATSDTRSMAGVIGGDLAMTQFWQGQLFGWCAYSQVSASLRQQVHSYAVQNFGATAVDALLAHEVIVRGGGVA